MQEEEKGPSSNNPELERPDDRKWYPVGRAECRKVTRMSQSHSTIISKRSAYCPLSFFLGQTANQNFPPINTSSKNPKYTEGKK
jgi:hypothetical protein